DKPSDYAGTALVDSFLGNRFANNADRIHNARKAAPPAPTRFGQFTVFSLAASNLIVISLLGSVCSTCVNACRNPRVGKFTWIGCTCATASSCACCNFIHCASAAALS